MKKVIVITGPTGVGKTKLSVMLAKKIDGEIINADSMQVYKGLDIGTAKIREDEKDGVPHHLFDICDIDVDYNIYDYQKDCRKVIDEIINRGKMPILVGGSGLYIKSALYNYEFQNEEFHDEFTSLSNEQLLREIEKDHPTDIHVNNRKRLVRELNKIKNQTKNTNNGKEPLYDIIMLGLTCPRGKLYEIIDKRVDIMLQDGLVSEVKKLYDQKLYTKAIMTGIGYKELYKYFNGELTLDESIDLIKKNSRHFAKRQYTFFRHQMDIHFINVNFNCFQKTVNEAYNYVQEQLKNKTN